MCSFIRRVGLFSSRGRHDNFLKKIPVGTGWKAKLVVIYLNETEKPWNAFLMVPRGCWHSDSDSSYYRSFVADRLLIII